MAPFAPLHAHSAFSFLDGAASVESLVLRTARLGLPALALTDVNSLTGVPALVRRCGKAGVKPIGGCEVILEDGHRLTLLADGPVGWASLCRVLTAAGRRDPHRKGLRVSWKDLEAHHTGVVCLSGGPEHGRVPVLLRCRRYEQAGEYARRCLALFGPNRYWIEVTRTLTEGEDRLSHSLFELADWLGVPAVATNPVRHATKAGVAAYDALCRVRLRLGPQDHHADLPLNAERYVKDVSQMAALFADRPDALHNAAYLAERLAPPLAPETRHYPLYPRVPRGESPFSYLAALTWCGAEWRYGGWLNGQVKARLVHELETIHDLGYCHYFLVCWDICRAARERGVGHALRGSAVGSAVVHCLGMSDHDPIARRISFDRFLSKGRVKPPDVDIDFQHDLRDQMMQYVRDAYGQERVANVSNYITYRGRSLLRDFGKALGFDTAEIECLRELLGHCRADRLAERIEGTPELRALGLDTGRYTDLFALCAQAADLPRHLGTHSSGIVVSDEEIGAVAPVQWAAKGVLVVALDKDDVEAPGIGLLKIDQLGLRALTAITLATGTIRESDPEFDYAARDRDDPETLAMIRAAQTVTGFQVESPAQMALQWRLYAQEFWDIVAAVALIRPGPLLGHSVEPYLWCRHGWRPVTYPLPELEPILRETYGRIMFQDQVLEVVRVVGDLTADEADEFQRAMTHARSDEEMVRLGRGLYGRAQAKGMTKKAFSRLWRQIKGFSKYGFCLGHAFAFADHAQGTAWLLRHHPADWLAAVLSVEPCGFWPVMTVVAEAQRRGVAVLPPCVNRSSARRWTLEKVGGGRAIRCALACVRELGTVADAVEDERRQHGLFADLPDACRRLHFLSREQAEWLALAGALDDLCPNRRQTLWSLPSLHHEARRGQAGKAQATGQGALVIEIPPLLPEGLPDFTPSEAYWRQWAAVGFSTEGHPMQPFREALEAAGINSCAALQEAKPGRQVRVAGLVLRPHRPSNARGTVFFTLEDETGLAHVTVLPDVYERIGAEVYGQVMLVITGKAERKGAGFILIADQAASVPLTHPLWEST